MLRTTDLCIATSLTAVAMRFRDTFTLADLFTAYHAWFRDTERLVAPTNDDALAVLATLEGDGQVAETDVGRWRVLEWH